MKNYFKEAGNIHLSYYIEAADILEIKYEIIVQKLMAKFEHKNKHWFIINTVTPLVNSPGKTIAMRKNLTNIILSKAGLPVPIQRTLTTVDEARSFYNEFEDIVLKPKQGLGGRGVGILPGSIEEAESSFQIAKKIDSEVLAEEYIKGDNYRLLTLDKNVIGAVKRHKPSVKGDGKTTIQNLILTQSPKTPIDSETIKVLKSQDLTLESIPKEEEIVITRNNTNLTTGGKTEEYSKNVHPYYKDLAVKAIEAIGIKFGGVDLIAEDITKPGKCAINEINYNPGLRIHYRVDKGEKIKVAIPIMKYIRDNEL